MDEEARIEAVAVPKMVAVDFDRKARRSEVEVEVEVELPVVDVVDDVLDGDVGVL